MKKRMKLDAEEKKLLASVDRGEWKSGGGGKRQRAHYARDAKSTVRKDWRLKIRLSEGRDEIADRLSLHQHLVINQVVARVQADHLNIECAAPTCRVEQRRLSFGIIHGESMGLSRHNPAERW